jgi:hypothetical protein
MLNSIMSGTQNCYTMQSYVSMFKILISSDIV